MEKILIVDDEEAIRLGIREFLEFEGCEVAEARDGSEAVKLCSQDGFELGIEDYVVKPFSLKRKSFWL